MDSETAQNLLMAITGIGALVWLIGLQFLVSSCRRQTISRADELAADAFALPNGGLTGSAEIEGQPNALAANAASILAKGSLFGPVKILAKTDDQIAFECLGAMAANQVGARWFRRAILRFSAREHGRTCVEWGVELIPMTWLVSLGVLFQVLGLLALVLGCWALFVFVASSPNAAIRWQTFQMLQVSHFLWPPFLVGALCRKARTAVAVQFEGFVHNLPYFRD
jgi:hypothetical protein